MDAKNLRKATAAIVNNNQKEINKLLLHQKKAKNNKKPRDDFTLLKKDKDSGINYTKLRKNRVNSNIESFVFKHEDLTGKNSFKNLNMKIP